MGTMSLTSVRLSLPLMAQQTLPARNGTCGAANGRTHAAATMNAEPSSMAARTPRRYPPSQPALLCVPSANSSQSSPSFWATFGKRLCKRNPTVLVHTGPYGRCGRQHHRACTLFCPCLSGQPGILSRCFCSQPAPRAPWGTSLPWACQA